MSRLPPWAETPVRNLQRLSRSRATMGLVLVLVLIQAGITAAGWTVHDAGPWETWGLSRNGVGGGKVHQIWTHAWIHGSWWHLVMNGVFVLAVGSRIEHMLGARMMAWTCVAGILAGAFTHLGLGQGLLVGFSGASLALWMLMIGLSPQARLLPFPGPSVWLGWGVILISVGLACCDPSGPWGRFHAIGRAMESMTGAWLFQIGHACHAGGALAGWLIGLWILRPRIHLATLQRQRAKRERKTGDSRDRVRR